MKTIQFVSYLVLGASACFGCSDAASNESGSLESTLTAPTQHCGGNIANAPTCPDGFECVPNPASHLPFGDVGGICQPAASDAGGGEHGCGNRATDDD